MKKTLIATLFVTVAIAAAQIVLSPTVRVTLDGKPMTEKGLIYKGTLYVPASDFAQATGRSVKTEQVGKAYAMALGGGANAADGASGKVGETLFNGKTRLTVQAPQVQGNKLVFNMEVRNAETKTKTYYLTLSESKYTLLDAEGSSMEAFSVSESFPDLQPGTMKRFVVNYDMSKGIVPERMVVSLHTHVPGSDPKKEVFRISLR